MGPGMKAAMMIALAGATLTPTTSLQRSAKSFPKQKPYTVNKNGKRTLKK